MTRNLRGNHRTRGAAREEKGKGRKKTEESIEKLIG
jgi:hypothetical protein